MAAMLVIYRRLTTQRNRKTVHYLQLEFPQKHADIHSRRLFSTAPTVAVAWVGLKRMMTHMKFYAIFSYIIIAFRLPYHLLGFFFRSRFSSECTVTEMRYTVMFIVKYNSGLIYSNNNSDDDVLLDTEHKDISASC